MPGGPTRKSVRPSPTIVGPVGDPHEPLRPGPGASCGLCGAPVPASPITWMVENTPRGTVWSCPACARTHLRAIEAKLDQEYW